jgi:hypothetical protein
MIPLVRMGLGAAWSAASCSKAAGPFSREPPAVLGAALPMRGPTTELRECTLFYCIIYICIM